MLNMWKRQLRWCLSLAGIQKAPANNLSNKANPFASIRRLIVTAGLMLLVCSETSAQDPARQAKIDQILSANPGLRFEPKSGKFFRLQPAAVTWTVAERDARDPAKHSINGVPGRLATIRSVEENTLVSEMCRVNYSYPWLSASDRHAEGDFKWYRDAAASDAITYSNWAAGQPFDWNGTMDYLEFAWWGQWQSRQDSKANPYVVEWSADDVVGGGGEVAQAPKPLSTVRVPLPDNLNEFVKDRHKAILLGKALFWDMQVGSDGRTACATCHNAAGIDQRTRNTLHPGAPGSAFGPQLGGQAELGSIARNLFRGANADLTAADFPFHKVADPLGSKDSNTVLRDTMEVAGSQGVVKKNFLGIVDGSPVDNGQLVADPIFNIDGANARQVTGRNTPTTINSVFFDRLFWDGRANHFFNGVNEFGNLDPDARVWVSVPGGTGTLAEKVNYLISKHPWLEPWRWILLGDEGMTDVFISSFIGVPYQSGPQLAQKQILLNNAALASQAVGPPLNGVEMSWHGRNFKELGRKLLTLRPLALQKVHGEDSVLGHVANTAGTGLHGHISYASLIRETFADQYWNSTQPTPDGFTQMEANFSLYWGLAIMMYEATLVSDQTPYDRFASGDQAALSDSAKRGLDIFLKDGKCINCHGGPEFAGATISDLRGGTTPKLVELMPMGDGGEAWYDNGFYNIGVRPTLEDIAIGASHPTFGPLSYVRQKQNGRDIGQDAAVSGRLAINGGFKTPTIRNIELTGPYFHNVGARTLEEVVEFYVRGADFFHQNIADLDPDMEGIPSLQGNPAGAADLVNFMKSLTDERVRFERAPFDHPQLLVPNGHSGTSNGVALDNLIELPAVGRNGGAPVRPFAEIVR